MADKKVALITGSARGIGKACAIELAKAGYDIVVNDIEVNAEVANATAAELKAFGVDSYAVLFDVTKKEAVEKGIEDIMAKSGRIDVLVNNAGITRDNLLIRMPADMWEAVINTNLSSAFYVSQPVVKVMMKQRFGAIVNMASISGVYGNAGQVNYSSAKAGLIGMTKTLAKELGSRNIRVNAVAPGFIKTPMTENLQLDGLVEHIPMRRLGEAEDVAKAVKFLAADTDYITGQVLQVDGGLVI